VAASVEAKKYGIKTGTKVAEAQAMCPDIVVVHDSPNSYRDIHRQIMTILHTTPCYVRAKSIDEAYLKVPSYLQSKNGAIQLIAGIKQALNDLYGGHILCSAGVASNIWLAKMGSNNQKPDGLVILTKDRLADFYKSISLLDMTGINFRMARQLYNLNIQNPWQLYNTSWKFLSSKLGVNGGKWYLRLRGFEVDIEKIQANKSISHQVTTMPNPPKNNAELTTYVNKIAVNLGGRLRRKELSASGIALSVRFIDGTWQGDVFKRVAMFRSDKDIIALSKMLLNKLFIDRPVRKLSITLFNTSMSKQLPLDIFNDKKPLMLSYAIDEINKKHGKNTIMPLRSFYAGHVDLNRVGFAGDLTRELSNPTDKKHFL
jgi:DNA polymerase-4